MCTLAAAVDGESPWTMEVSSLRAVSWVDRTEYEAVTDWGRGSS
jgi:hypothetical protein